MAARAGLVSAALALSLMVVSQAQAACPVDRALYRDRDAIAELAFRPVEGQAAVTNLFSLTLRGRAAFDGVVMWTDEPARPTGLLMSNCPEGDVTGAELAACTLWQGVVYAIADDGAVGLLDAEGDAPRRLLLSDLAGQLAVAPALAKDPPAALPWDAFEFAGCRE